MDGRPTWTDCDEAGDYVVPNVLSPRDLVFRPDNMDETVTHTTVLTKLAIFVRYLYAIFEYHVAHYSGYQLYKKNCSLY